MKKLSTLDEFKIRSSFINDILKQLKSKPILSVIQNLEDEDMYINQFIDTVNEQVYERTADLRKEIAKNDKIIAEKEKMIAQKQNLIAQS
jgi:uncharacterized protein (DUF2344 family)